MTIRSGRLAGLIVCALATAAGSASAAPPPRAAAYEAIAAYGRRHQDPATRLITDASGRPNLVDSSVGVAAATLEGPDADHALARQVIAAILDNQDAAPGSATQGRFRWTAGSEQPFSADAALYLAPPLAYIRVTHGAAALGAELDGRLGQALSLCAKALARDGAPDEEGTRRLMRQAALATIGRALGEGTVVSRAADSLAAWGENVRQAGVPEGQSPTYDALKVAAARWVIWAGGRGCEPTAELLWRAFAQRVDASATYIAGAMRTAYPADYLTGAGLPRALIRYDLGRDPQGSDTPPDPLAVYVLLPPAPNPPVEPPAAPYTITAACSAPNAPIERCDTYIGPELSLGTLTGFVGGEGIIAFATCTGPPPRSAYFFIGGSSGRVASVQHQSTALVSANFDQLGTMTRRQAWVDGILGRRRDIERVLLFGKEWPGMSVGVGEMSAVAVQTAGCYLGVRILRCGPAAAGLVQEGGKPGVLSWTSDGPDGWLQLRIYARQDSTMTRPVLDNVRATFIIRVEPVSAFGSLDEFAREMVRPKVTQSVKAERVRVPEAEGQDRPPMLTRDKPRAKMDFVYRHLTHQTIEYASEGLTLGLAEELVSDTVMARTVNGVSVQAMGPWTSPLLTLLWAGAQPQDKT